MKKIHRILILQSIWIFLIFLMAAPLSAKTKQPSFPRSEFKQVRAIVCKEYDASDKDCAYNKFDIEGIDLNGDKKVEWFFYGPRIECGEHGNCPLNILQKTDKWSVLYSGWGNSYKDKPLSSLHQGYRDLEISGEMTPFLWTKDILIWNGAAYKDHPNSTTYYRYDGEKLIRVSKRKWDDCLKNGCPDD